MSDFAISPQMVHAQGDNPHQSQGFSFRDLLNPVSLIGRICEDWKPIAAVVLVVVGVATSIFAWSLLNLFLFVALGGVASILIRDIRDLGTHNELNKDHADNNDDQVLITINLAAEVVQLAEEVDGLDLVRQQLEVQNTGHVETNARQDEIVGQQAEQIRVATDARAEERKQFEVQLREQKAQTELIAEQRKALEQESARARESFTGEMRALSEKVLTLTTSASAIVAAERKFTEASQATQSGARETTAELARHAETVRGTLERASEDSAQLTEAKDQVVALMERVNGHLGPVRELLQHAAEYPTGSDNLRVAKEAQEQVRASTKEHAKMQAEVAALTETLEGLKRGIADAERRFETASGQILGVTGTLVTARDQALRATSQLTATQQVAALQQHQQHSGTGHHGAGASLPILPVTDQETWA